MKNGLELIAEERKRQIEVEGWTLEHDKKYKNNELFYAACCYYAAQRNRALQPNMNPYEAPDEWPFDKSWWKPSPDDRIRELVKAGALFFADNQARPSEFSASQVELIAKEINQLINNNIEVYQAEDTLNPEPIPLIEGSMTEQEFYDDIMGEYYQELDEHRQKLKRNNDRILKAIKSVNGKKFYKDVIDAMDDADIGFLELVKKPSGGYQEESYRVIPGVWVEQWTGHECDDYYGNLFIEVKKDKYLKIPYSC